MKNKQKNISRMILDYLRKHPDAGDTLEGITKWWIKLQRIEESTDDISAALEHLLRMGRLVKVRDSDGVAIYKATNIHGE